MANRTVKVASHPDLMQDTEAADKAGLNPKSLQRMAREGRGPKRVRIGNRVYYSRQQFDDWLRQKFESDAA
jgi:predicted DNA-binding transcriptional regulator AlpA